MSWIIVVCLEEDPRKHGTYRQSKAGKGRKLRKGYLQEMGYVYGSILWGPLSDCV